VDELAAEEILLFDDFRLDRRAGGLFRADQSGVLVPVVIGSRALDLLILLVGRHGDLVVKDEIMTTVWPGMVVEDSNLPTQISALRRVLDQGRSQGSCIQTVSGRGYRFPAAVRRREPDTPVNATALSRDRASLRPRLSIVVLPFTNLSSNPDQQYFADGITEDLTIELSRLWDMLVISCTTAFSYRNKSVATKQIGRELGVRYVYSKGASGGRVTKSASMPS
jgi:DNA-binding winged helix-turn-helix (wHTH) protein